MWRQPIFAADVRAKPSRPLQNLVDSLVLFAPVRRLAFTVSTDDSVEMPVLVPRLSTQDSREFPLGGQDKKVVFLAGEERRDEHKVVWIEIEQRIKAPVEVKVGREDLRRVVKTVEARMKDR